MDSYKLYNFRMLDDSTVIYSAGTSYKIHNIHTGEVRLFFSKDGGGIGCIAVDNQRRFFAVAEKGVYPCIYIYEYPSLRVYRILRHGTEKSYSNVSFSLRGDKLASVGSEPDFNICIWDWRNEILVLKAKAFSQEVFRVVFSDHSDSILSTCGMAHLRFWKIAGTFTGLKLKGQTGKFGSVELSDITGFYIFPDGKVLSGSENGRLLLWEGNLIKAVLGVSEQVPCHKGLINTVCKLGSSIISAGADGYVRYWDFKTIDDIEANDDLSGYISPTKEFLLLANPDAPPEEQQPANIMEIVDYKSYWLVHDAMGRLFKLVVTEDGLQQDVLLHFNSGKFMGVSPSRNSNACATVGQDGVIRLHDFVNRKEYYSRHFKGRGTCIDWLAMTFNHRDRFAAVGYDTGIVRIVHFSKSRVYLVKAMKVHNSPIKNLSFSPSGETLAVLSSLGEIFFLSVEPVAGGGVKVEPVCVHPLNKKINYMTWGRKLDTLLLATDTGQVVELQVPKPEDFDSTLSYLNESLKSRSYTIKMMEFQKPKIDENDINFLLDDKVVQQVVEWDPAPISSVAYLDEEAGKFICSVEGEYIGYYYVCRFGGDRPLDAVQSTPAVTRMMAKTSDERFLLCGTEAGEVFLRPLNNLQVFARLPNHDQNDGSVVGAFFNPDMDCIISAAQDATLIAKAVDLKYVKEVTALRVAQLADRERRKHNKKRGIPEEAEKKKDPEQEDEEGKEEAEEEPSDDDSDEDKKAKVDQFDIAISKIAPVAPQLKDGIDDAFFFDDVERADAPDILDDNIYSIQEEKLLAEEDKRKSIAEEKKRQMREEISALRNEFESIKKYEGDLDSFYKLEFKDFNIDEDYYQMLKDRVAEMLDETQKEVSWSIEFHKLKTQKLKKFFLSELEFDRLAVKAFKKPCSVTTLRVKAPSEYTLSHWGQDTDTSKLGDEKKAEQDKAKELNKQEQAKESLSLIDQWLAERHKERTELKQAIDQNFLKNKKDKLRRQQIESSKQKFTRQKMKADKEVRSKMKQELLERKPEAKSILDNQEIKEAQKNMGNYVLKSDPKFELPPNQDITVRKQKKTVILLEEFVYGCKKDFNICLLEMREAKKELFNKILQANTRIQQINAQLNIQEQLFVPEWDQEIEFPEKIYEVTPEEISELARQKEEERLRKKQGRFGNAEEKPEDKSDPKEGAGGKKERVELQYKERKNIRTQASPLEQEMNEIKLLRLRTEKKLLTTEIESEVREFDDKLVEMSNKKIILEYEIKYVMMKLITSYQELIILDAYEKKDEILHAEHEKQKAKDRENTENINKNSMLIKEKKDSQKTLEAKYKDAEAKFNEKITQLGDYSKEDANAAYQIYKANQKRHKNSQNPDEDGGDLDGGMDDEEDVASIHAEPGGEPGPEVARAAEELAVGLPQRGFRARQVRGREAPGRVQGEPRPAEHREEGLRGGEGQGHEAAHRHQRQDEGGRPGSPQLQKEKLEKVSTLYVSFFMRLSQIQNLKDSKGSRMPNTLENSIVFTNKDLEKLVRNQEVLEKEISSRQ